MVRFLLKQSDRFRKKAVSILQLKRFKKLRKRDRKTIAKKLNLIRREADQVLRIMSAYSPGAAKGATGFHLTYGEGEQRGVIIFDMVDGSHCYEIDPPGICCCDPC